MDSILFLGGMFPKNSKIINTKSRGNIQNAANALQWGIINALLKEKDLELTLASAAFVGSYPALYSDIMVNGFEKVGVGIEYISFLNLPVIKNISRYFNVKKYVRNWVKKNKNNRKYVIAYSAHTPFIKAVAKIKEKYGLNFHLIVPDLPQYMNLKTKVSPVYSFLKNIDIKIQNEYLSTVDSFTFLTDKMSSVYNIYKKPYTVVEGMIDMEFAAKTEDFKPLFSRTAVYTGTLEKKYGILNLVKAMKFVKGDIRLIICGTGDAVPEIEEAAKKDNRIEYRGIVEYKEALKIQSEAGVLVNPRPADEEYTKYSFPSKNLEYMLWNKPVAVFKLSGIPDEYDDVLIYFSDKNPEKMAEVINGIFEKPEEELLKIGKRTTEFAVNNKNNIKQTAKILSCLKGDS